MRSTNSSSPSPVSWNGLSLSSRRIARDEERTRSSWRHPMRSISVSAATAECAIATAPPRLEPDTSSSTARLSSISTPRTTSSLPKPSRASRWMPAEGRLEIVALDGIPEIEPGDDLASLIGDAIERTSGILPLATDDVLVVTQKVVSKAEDAIVDLTAIEPRPEAIAFAERWDRDARQVEVVLREARRVVRMDNGVVITETPHGFVCANGGVDASNVGKRSGEIVTLLPADPDASAARIRDRVRAATGVDVPVVISDS